MDVFKVPSTLEEISSKGQTQSIQEVIQKIEEMKTLEPQVLSARWVDSEEKNIAVYFSWSKYSEADRGAANEGEAGEGEAGEGGEGNRKVDGGSKEAGEENKETGGVKSKRAIKVRYMEHLHTMCILINFTEGEEKST